jgi:hypothetical protein
MSLFGKPVKKLSIKDEHKLIDYQDTRFPNQSITKTLVLKKFHTKRTLKKELKHLPTIIEERRNPRGKPLERSALTHIAPA